MITRKTKNTEKLIDRIRKLCKEKVKSGYFPEQGYHENSEMTYVELASYHAYGGDEDHHIPARDVRIPTLFTMKSYVGLLSNLSKYFYKDMTISESLNDIGYKVSGIAVSHYGVINSKGMPANHPAWAKAKGGNTPLVEEGDLRDAWSWKNTVDNIVMNYKGSPIG